ncbi:MAG: lamin tail domain-containing protein, partial [Planctomycetota bacterium]
CGDGTCEGEESEFNCEVDCGPPLEPQACCYFDGSCQDQTPTDCTNTGGTPQGEGTDCATTNCPQPEACCYSDGLCQDQLAADCTASGGLAKGAGTSCATSQCLQACCYLNGSCQDATVADCIANGGTSQGLGTDCATANCPQPEACCYSDGSCQDEAVANCTANGGTSKGPGTDCATTDCVSDIPQLVINEIDYDQPGTDDGEFIEIKNTGTASVNLAGYTVELVNGWGGGAVIYKIISLPDLELNSGGYFVVCGNAANVDNCDLDVSPDTDLIQNGTPDAVAITFNNTVIDTVSYGGDTGAPYTEGSGSGLLDPWSNIPGGPEEYKGISRFPDGVDTNQNNIDFSVRCITPGESNISQESNCITPQACCYSDGSCQDVAPDFYTN